MATKWNDFSSVQQAAIAKAFSGTRQQNRFIAMMEGYGKVLKLTETATHSAGMAIDKYNKSYVDSLEAKQATLQASFESMIMNSDFSEVYAGILDATNALVEFMDKTNALKGVMSGLAVGGAIKTFIGIRSGINQAYIELNKFQNAINLVSKSNISAKEFDRLLLLSNGLSKSQMKLVLSTNALSVAQKKELLIASGLSEEEAILQLQTWKMTTANTGLTASTISVSNAFRALWTNIKANPMLLIVSGITLGVTAWQTYKQHLEEVRQATDEAATTFEDGSKSIDDYTERYKELRQALITAKGNEEETYRVKQQLLDLQTELNDKFGEEYGRLNLVTDAYKDQTDAIASYNKKLAETYLNENQEGIEDATKQMTKKKDYMLSETGIFEHSEYGKELKKIVEQYADKGIYALADVDGNFSIHLTADAQSAYDTINDFETDVRNRAKELGDEDLFSGVLEISSKELNRAKETIDDYGNLYKQALIAEIITDDSKDGSKSVEYGKALEAVEAYNDAVAKSEDPLNDKNVEKARKNLETIKTSIQSNEKEWGKYSYVTNDVFDQADTRVYDFNQKLKSDDSLKSLTKELEGLKDVDLKAMSDDGDNGDTFDKLAKKADEYGVTVDELIDLLVKLGVVQNTVNKEMEQATQPSYTDTLAQVQALSKGLDQLDKIYSDVKDKKDFDWSSILNNKDFEETFGNMQNVTGEYKNAYEDFIQTVSNSPTDIKACQTAFDNLATAYINNSSVLDNLTEETKASTIAMLEQMGIANADVVVTAKLAAQELALKLNMEGTTDEISKQISDLINHGEASGIAATALFDLVTQEKVFNTTGLSVADRVKELEKLATAFGIATDSANTYWTVERQLAYAKSRGISEEEFLANTVSKYQDVIEERFGFLTAKYTGGANTNKTNPSSSSSSAKSKDTKQTIDWISRKFDILAKQLDVIKKKASEVYSTFKNQNKQLDLAVQNIENQIALYKKAYTAYMKQADSVGLSTSLKEKVRNGAMNVTEYSGKTAEKIQEYQKYYDLAQDTLKTITELKLEEKELARQKLSNITDDYDKKKSYQEALASLREAKAGDNPTEKDYNYLIKKQNHIKANLQKEQKTLESEFNALVKNGTIKKYSDAWYEWKEKIVGVKVEIEDCNNEIEDLAENIIDIRWEKFDKAIGKLDTIGDKLSKIKNFFDGNLFDGTSITKAGLANVALGFADMANEKQKLVNYQAEKNRLNTMLSDSSLTSAEREKYEERLKEIEQLEIESALNIKNARQSIIDIYIESIEEETDAMRDLIESKKDALDAERALHNYRRSIADKEEDIAILQKKIEELSRSSDRKEQALKLELEEELKKAKEDLAEEQYQHDIDQQQEALDEELSDFEKMQDQKIKDVKNNLDTQEKILNQYFSDVKSGWTTMIDYMRSYGNQFGVDMTSTLTDLLESAKNLTEFMDVSPNVDYSTKHVNKNQTDIPIRDIGIGAVVGAGTAIVSGSGNSSTGKKKDTSGDKDVVFKEKASTLPGTIKYGDSGKNVTVLQKALNALGFSVGSTGADGKFGSKTLAAVKAFQKSTKVKGGAITADGIVGTNTKKKFKANNYRRGVKDLKENQLALTQEDGTEIVLRPSEGILTPLQKGDSVLTSAQTDNLIALSKMTPVDMSRLWNA